jgi:FkbM family methyltransferase
VGYSGQVLSFEPVPRLAASLQLRADVTEFWDVEASAVGGEIGTLALNVMQSTELSSFLVPDHSKVGDLLRGHNEIDHTVDVNVLTIDSILPALTIKYASKNIFLKIDTQGFDLEVLKGATASLPNIAALQTEASVTPVYAGMPGYHDVIQFLEEHGFIVSGIYPVSADFFPRLIEFDCYMINGLRVP